MFADISRFIGIIIQLVLTHTIVCFVLGTKSVLTVKTGRIISEIFLRTINLTRRKWFNGKLLKQHLRQDSLQQNRTEMKFVKRQVAMKGPVLKPVLDSPSPVWVWLWIQKWQKLHQSTSERYPSKSTRCLTIQNFSDEDWSSYEAEARSSDHSATDCTSRSSATDRLTQFQNVSEMPKSTG